MDGHERADIIAHPKEYLTCLKKKKLSDTHQVISYVSLLHLMEKHELIIIYYDESIFNTNEGQSWMWGTGEEPCLQTKTMGAGIKMSDLYSGFL